MKPRALIVEDDERIIDSIEDELFSIDHEHDWVSNLHDARKMLAKQQYTYILLDLQIPAKPNRPMASIDYGINLLAEMEVPKNPSGPRVIIMTGFASEALDRSIDLMGMGASAFISKPIADRIPSLSTVVKGVLAKPVIQVPTSQPPETSLGGEFTGGEMVFYEDRVELCDVTVLVNSRARLMRRILEELKNQTSSGRYVARSGPELVERLNLRNGQNSVAGAVRDFRRNVESLLREQCGLMCKTQDVIRSGGPGYRLNEWIKVGGTDDGIDACETAPTMSRCDWILSALRGGRQLRTADIASELDCSSRTVKRELDSLRARDLVEFVGPSKTGVYRLKC